MASNTSRVSIHRRSYNRLAIEENFEKVEREGEPPKVILKRQIKKACACSRKCLKKKVVETLPCIKTLTNYNVKKHLLYDIMAGLSVGIVHIPQSMGFALLASLPPVYGLYSSFFQPLLYFFFAMSTHNSLGTMAVPSLIISQAVERELNIYMRKHPVSEANLSSVFMNPDLDSNMTDMFNLTDDMNITLSSVSGFDPEAKKAAIATTITLIAGLLQLAMAFLRLGMVTTFMPASFIGGFTTACGFFIAVSQIPSIFGIKTKRHSGIFRLIKLMIDIFQNLKNTNPATFLVAVVCFAMLIFLKEFINERYRHKLKIPIPAELIVVILGTLISYLAKFYERFGIANVGKIPKGFPAPAVPPMEFASSIITEAIVLAILSFVISISMANVFAKKYKYPLDSNQEMMAYGIMHTVSSFFHCFGGACAPPRAYVFEKSGGCTNVAYLFSCVLLFLVIMILGPLFESLPKVVLASVIVVALFPLFKQFKDLRLFWKISKFDFYVWLVTWFFTVITDVGIGLGIGVGYVLISYICQSLMAPGHFMALLETHDLAVREDAFNKVKKLPKVRLFRFESQLYFATVQQFKRELFKGTFNPVTKLKDCKPKAAEDLTDMEIVIENPSETENKQNDRKPEEQDTCDTDTIKHIIIDCSSLNFIDIMGIGTLRQLKEDFEAVGVTMSLINCSPGFRSRLTVVNLLGKNPAAFPEYPTVQDALANLPFVKKERNESNI